MDSSSENTTATQAVDAIIQAAVAWQGKVLAEIRAAILDADPAITEEVKWKKPSRPAGVPVWVRDGNVCIGETLKNGVRLTFPKGAQLPDPKQLFNTRLDSKTVRAIDFHEGAPVDESALQALVVKAVKLNVANTP